MVESRVPVTPGRDVMIFLFGVAVAAADVEFTDRLVIPDGLLVKGNVIGGTIYFFLKSLHELCGRVRQGGLGKNIGDVLKEILAVNGISQGKFKMADRGVYATLPDGKQEECRYRYHLRSGSPTETERVYWADSGEKPQERVFVIAHIGLHAG